MASPNGPKLVAMVGKPGPVPVTTKVGRKDALHAKVTLRSYNRRVMQEMH